MFVYLAANFERRDEIRGYANELMTLGIGITSRWLWYDSNGNRTDENKKVMAAMDISDIHMSDAFILFLQDPNQYSTEGKSFELGVAYATGVPNIMVIGSPQTVFHHLDEINFYIWAEAKRKLRELKDARIEENTYTLEDLGRPRS